MILTLVTFLFCITLMFAYIFILTSNIYVKYKYTIQGTNNDGGIRLCVTCAFTWFTLFKVRVVYSNTLFGKRDSDF